MKIKVQWPTGKIDAFVRDQWYYSTFFMIAPYLQQDLKGQVDRYSHSKLVENLYRLRDGMSTR